MDRLAEYAIRSQEVQQQFNSDNNIFNMFKANIDNVKEKDNVLRKMISLQSNLTFLFELI